MFKLSNRISFHLFPSRILYIQSKAKYYKLFQPLEIFSEFDPEPLGTASLAQVHKAKLKDGTTVAVKVQHPYVKDNSLLDMKTMEVGNIKILLNFDLQCRV